MEGAERGFDPGGSGSGVSLVSLRGHVSAVTTAGGAQQKTNNRRRINDFITITFHFYRLRVLWRETTRPGEGFLPRGRREAYDHRQNSGLEEESIGVEERG